MWRMFVRLCRNGSHSMNCTVHLIYNIVHTAPKVHLRHADYTEAKKRVTHMNGNSSSLLCPLPNDICSNGSTFDRHGKRGLQWSSTDPENHTCLTLHWRIILIGSQIVISKCWTCINLYYLLQDMENVVFYKYSNFPGRVFVTSLYLHVWIP